MKEELSEYLPEPIINHLETVYKIFKESPLPPAEKEKALLRYTQKLHSLDNYLLDPMLDTLGVKPTGQTESPYVWVQRLTPDGRVKWEFKRRDEVMGYNPLPETKEDIAEKMARENRLTGLDLYKALPDLYSEELRALPPREEEKKLEADIPKTLEKEEIEKLKEEKDKALEQYKEEAKGKELEPPSEKKDEDEFTGEVITLPSEELEEEGPDIFSQEIKKVEETEESKKKRKEKKQASSSSSNVNVPRVETLVETPEEQERLRKIKEEKYKLYETALSEVKDKIISKYPFYGEERITKEDAFVIFQELENIVKKYIKPNEYDKYINSITNEYYNIIGTGSAYVNKKKFRQFIMRTITHMYYDELFK